MNPTGYRYDMTEMLDLIAGVSAQVRAISAEVSKVIQSPEYDTVMYYIEEEMDAMMERLRTKHTNMPITAQMVHRVREEAGAGLMESKTALQKANGNVEAAIEHIKSRRFR